MYQGTYSRDDRIPYPNCSTAPQQIGSSLNPLRTAIACRYCGKPKIRRPGIKSNTQEGCLNCIWVPVSTQAQAFVPAHAAGPHMRDMAVGPDGRARGAIPLPAGPPYVEYAMPSPTGSYSSFTDGAEPGRKRLQPEPHQSILPPPMRGKLPYPQSSMPTSHHPQINHNFYGTWTKAGMCRTCRQIDFQSLVPKSHRVILPTWYLADLLSETRCEFCKFLGAKIAGALGYLCPKDLATRLSGQILPWQCVKLASLRKSMEFKIVMVDRKEGFVGWLARNFSNSSPRQCDIETYLSSFEILPPSQTRHPYFAVVGKQSKLPFIPGTFLERSRCRIGQIVPPDIQPDLISTWLRRCEAKHSSCGLQMASMGPFDTILELMVLDLIDQCVVSTSTPVRYIALSYVWGNIAQPKLLLSNLGVLQQPGGLQFFQLPRTIRDACDLTRILGERYLWVDSLCIIQDDPEHRRSRINEMHKIYHGAFLTIVAAAGDNCDHGIAGVSISRLPRTSFDFQLSSSSGKMLSITSTEGYTRKGSSPLSFHHWRLQSVSQSVWYTRGWTFQEDICSRRKLIFTGSMMIFVCDQDMWREDLRLPERRLHINGKRKQNQTTKVQVLSRADRMMAGEFIDVLNEYLGRQLSQPEDRLNAFAGVQGFLYPYIGSFVSGMPEQDFMYTLQWTTQARISRRKGFPSWSWTGWEGLSSCKVDLRNSPGSLLSIEVGYPWRVIVPAAERPLSERRRQLLDMVAGPSRARVLADRLLIDSFNHPHFACVFSTNKNHCDSQEHDRILAFSTSYARLPVVLKQGDVFAVLKPSVRVKAPMRGWSTARRVCNNGLDKEIGELTTINLNGWQYGGAVWMDFIVISYSTPILNPGSGGFVLMMITGICDRVSERIGLCDTPVPLEYWWELNPQRRFVLLS